MKRLGLIAAGLILTASMMGAAAFITEKQSIVGGALEAIGCTPVPSKVIGGPQSYKLTKEACEKLHGKTIVVDGDGSVTIK